MKIAIVSTFDAGNIKTWSGIPYSIISQLKKEHQVDIIELSLKRTLISCLRGIWFNKIIKKEYFTIYDTSLYKSNRKKINGQIKKEYDLIISFQFYLLPYITGKKVLITDATFDNLSGYYFDATKVSSFSVSEANKIYSKCIFENHVSIFSSDWALNSAIKKYNGNPARLFTIPFGANLTYIPTINEVDTWIVEKSRSQICQLLFLGAFWERKGGLDSLDILKNLIFLGMDCKLTIVGCKPEIPNEIKDFVDVMGFLDKENEEESNFLNQLLKTSHVLLLPSLAECAACVYAEANAYGIPVIGRDTGGVSTIIKDGINGLLLTAETTNLQLAQKWKDIFLNKGVYEKMCFDSKNEYEKRLNYSTFYESFMEAVSIL